MIISNSRKFIFVHVYKTAGEAITHALSPHLDWRDVELGSTPYGKRLDPVYASRHKVWKHSPARDVRALVGEAVWRDYLTFSVVREPYARALSLHRYLEREARRKGWRRRLARWWPPERARAPWSWPMMRLFVDTDSFSAFIRHPEFGRAMGTEPQVSFLCDTDRRTVIVDRLLRFERLDAEFAALCAAIGVEGAGLEKKNVSHGKLRDSATPQILDAADRAVLAKVYAADFEVFGYAP